MTGSASKKAKLLGLASRNLNQDFDLTELTTSKAAITSLKEYVALTFALIGVNVCAKGRSETPVSA